jgi:hypothetical protein
MKYAAVIFFAGVAFGQQYEIGATVGYGIYRDGTIYSASGSAEAGIRNRFAAGILLADEFSRYVSVEFNYLYHDGHPFLQAPGVKSDIQGNSDALTCGLLFHFKPREHRWRPFLAGGTGAKEYVIAGPEPFPQANPQIASLTTNDVWKVVFKRRWRREVPPAPAHAAAGGIPRLPNHVPQAADRSRSARHGPRNL